MSSKLDYQISRWSNSEWDKDYCFFWDRFGGMQEKEKVLRGGEGKTKLRERGGVEAIV